MEDHHDQIECLVGFPGVQNVTLDFGIALRDVAVHSDLLTPKFLGAVADTGIAVELSHYPCSEEQTESEADIANKPSATAPEPGEE